MSCSRSCCGTFNQLKPTPYLIQPQQLLLTRTSIPAVRLLQVLTVISRSTATLLLQVHTMSPYRTRSNPAAAGTHPHSHNISNASLLLL
jgi:hypothetical protein